VGLYIEVFYAVIGILYPSLVPRLVGGRRESLVSTVCACV